MNNNIISITAQSGTEPCNVDMGTLHESLLQLPAEKYLQLYHMMKNRIDGKLYFSTDSIQIPVIPPLAKGGVLNCNKA